MVPWPGWEPTAEAHDSHGKAGLPFTYRVEEQPKRRQGEQRSLLRAAVHQNSGAFIKRKEIAERLRVADR